MVGPPCLCLCLLRQFFLLIIGRTFQHVFPDFWLHACITPKPRIAYTTRSPILSVSCFITLLPCPCRLGNIVGAGITCAPGVKLLAQAKCSRHTACRNNHIYYEKENSSSGQCTAADRLPAALLNWFALQIVEWEDEVQVSQWSGEEGARWGEGNLES